MVARLYSGRELKEAESKVETSCSSLLVDKAPLTPLPTIEEGLGKAALWTTPPRGEEQVHNCSTSMYLLQWDQFAAAREGFSRVRSGQRSQLAAACNFMMTKFLDCELTGGCRSSDDITKSPAKSGIGLFLLGRLFR